MQLNILIRDEYFEKYMYIFIRMMIAYLKLPIEVSHQTKCSFYVFVTTLNLFWIFWMTYIPESMKHIKQKKWSPTNDVKNNHRYQHSHDLRELKEGEVN